MKHINTYLGLAAVCAALVLPVFSQERTIETTARRGSRTPIQISNRSARLMGPYSQSQKLRVIIGLKSHKAAEEQAFIEALYTKGSPEYHKFLTAKEWNDRFAPSAQDEQAVVDWAASQGLTVTQRYAHRLIVEVEAPVAQIQRALGVGINRYQLNSETVFSNDRDPVIPPQLSGIITSFFGLNNVEVMRPHTLPRKRIVHPDYVEGPPVAHAGNVRASGDISKLAEAKANKQKNGLQANATDGIYDPIDITGSNAYNFDGLYNLGHCCNPLHHPGGSPVETSIVIVTAGAQQLSDIQGFQKQYPHLAINVDYINVDGTPQCCDIEGTLDTEWATAMSNSFGDPADTAHIFVYQGVSPNHATFIHMFSQALADGLGRVLSTSWSATEFTGANDFVMDTEDSIFRSMTAQGWTVIAASGDNGSVGDCQHELVEFPASSPNVIAAGGTDLVLDVSDGKSNFVREGAWTGGTSPGSCVDKDGGGGGGLSSKFAVPFYQAYLGLGTRALPDISLNANRFQDIFFQGARDLGAGTSIVAPELAGFFAQENAYLLYLGSLIGDRCFGNQACAPIGNANYYMYIEDQNQPYAPHYPFYDVMTGCNSNDITIATGQYFCATPGYDLATGLGSANMLQLAWTINYDAAGDFGPPTAEFFGAQTNTWYNTPQPVFASFSDTTRTVRPATGVAGFSLAWDKDPAPESAAKPTPGSGDAFYSGPQYPNQLRGVLLLENAGQGCHTAEVKAWDNTGTSSGVLTYGPVCYDTKAPATTLVPSTAPNSSGWFTTPVTLAVNGKDPMPGSGVATTYYSVDQPSCSPKSLQTCSAANGPIQVSSPGAHTVYFFSRDAANNYEQQKNLKLRIDAKQPATIASLTGTKVGSSYTSNVAVKLTATDDASGVAQTVYQIDGGPATPYNNGFSIAANGAHQITYHSVDKAGNKEPGKTASFTINRAAVLTRTAVTQSQNPTAFGQAVTFTATVTASGSTPAGSVTLSDGSTTLGTVALSGGKASFKVAALGLGNHSITAKYAGAGGLIGSASAAITHSVNKAASSTAVSSSQNPSTSGHTVTFTATVKPAFGASVPTGKVTFKTATATLGAATLSNGKAVLATAALGKGQQAITASYSGESHYAGSSKILTQTVN